MRIKSAQMDAFRQAALGQFEDDMVEHLIRFAPIQAKQMGDHTLRQVIQLAIGRAANYGFYNRGPVQLYIDLIFILGVDFDTDPQLPWAEVMLRDAGDATPTQMSRANNLYNGALTYVKNVMGINYEYSREALRRLVLGRAVNSKAELGEDDQALARALARIYPQKSACVGPIILQVVCQKATKLGEQYNIAVDFGGSVLMAGLIFILGHGFVHDPRFPWVAAAFDSSLPSDTRIERLYSMAKEYLVDSRLANDS